LERVLTGKVAAAREVKASEWGEEILALTSVSTTNQATADTSKIHLQLIT
jgi:hypothetical protein